MNINLLIFLIQATTHWTLPPSEGKQEQDLENGFIYMDIMQSTLLDNYIVF